MTPDKRVEEIAYELLWEISAKSNCGCGGYIDYDIEVPKVVDTLTQLVKEVEAGERERILGSQSIPDRLRETRLHLGLSQEEVGKRLGYSAMAISHFEKGSRPIPEKVLGEFIMIFGSLIETKANNRRGKALTPPTSDVIEK